MTEHEATTPAHSASFHPHITPLKVYILVGATLFLLTGVTVWVAQFHLGTVGNLIVAMTVATIKATLVALFFMHLLYDNKLYLVVFLSALLFLSIFISMTMMDTMRRDDLFRYEEMPAAIGTSLTLEEPTSPEEAAATDKTGSEPAETPANP